MRIILVYASLILCSEGIRLATGSPERLSPPAGTATGELHPHFSWTYPQYYSLNASTGAEFVIELTNAHQGARTIDVVPALITRWVPAQPLEYGNYTWRVGAREQSGGNISWSSTQDLYIVEPVQTFQIGHDATLETVRTVIAEAVAASIVHTQAHRPPTPEQVQSRHSSSPPSIPVVEVLFAPSISYEFDLRPPFPVGCGWTGNEAASAGASRQTDENYSNQSFISNHSRLGNPPHCYLFNLTGAQGLRIRGQGSNFTFRSGYVTFLGTYKSTRVHVDGFGVDFDPIPNTALLPLGGAQGGKGPPATRSFLAALAPGHPPLDDPTVGTWLVKYGIAGIQARLGLQGGVPGRVQRGSKEVVPYTVNLPPVPLPVGGAGRFGASKGQGGASYAREQSRADGLGLNAESGAGRHDRFAWAHTRDGTPVYNLTIESTSQDIKVDEKSAVVIDPRIATGFDMYRSDTVVISDVTVWACSNECANSAYTPRVSMIRLQIRRKEGRYYAANNGGHNHHNARTGAWWEGGITESTGDDGSNFNCLESLVSVASQPPSPTTELHLKPGQYDPVGNMDGDIDYRTGDLVQIYNRTAGGIVLEAFVTSVEQRGVENAHLDGSDRPGGALGRIRTWHDGFLRRKDEERAAEARVRGTKFDSGSSIAPHSPSMGKIPRAAAPTTVVRLDRTIPVDLTGPRAGYIQVFNWNRTATQLAVRNMYLRNTRRVGLLLHGNRMLVQNVQFEGLGGGAVEAWPDPAAGPGLRSALVANCSITDVCQLNRVAAPVWLASFSRNNSRVHGDIAVRGCSFDTGPGSDALLWDVEGGALENNSAVRCEAQLDPTPWVGVENTGGSVVWEGRGNRVAAISRDPRLCVKQQS